MKENFFKQFKEAFSLDLRALGFLRIGVAIAVMMDLAVRFSDLEAHYSNSGVLPLEALFRYLWNPAYFSLYTIAGSWQLQALVFAANFGCALCLLLGYRTRLFSVICWLFILSLHNRNPLIQQGGDDLLRMLLFWGMFLPWGYYYSLDSRSIRKPLDLDNAYFSVAGVGYICQVFFVYFFSALLKSSAEWNSEYTALYYALSLDQVVTHVGKLIYPYADFLKFATAATYQIELIVPFFLFMPFLNSYFRVAFIVLITGLHLGINLCLYVGLFPVIGVTALLGLVPVRTADYLGQRQEKWQSGLQRWLGRLVESVEPLLPNPIEKRTYVPREKLITSVAMLFFCAYTWVWNAANSELTLPGFDQYRWVGNFLRIDQFWGMFAPSVFKDDGWFVLAAKTKDGKAIDIAQGGAPAMFDKPDFAADFYKNDRWRKYHENMLFVDKSHFRGYYCNYLLNKWHEDPDNPKVASLQIIYMKEITLPDYKPAVPTKEVLAECQAP